MSSVETNKETIRGLIQNVWNGGDLDGVSTYVAPDIVFHDAPTPNLPPGIEGVKHIPAFWRSAFPDMEITIDDLIGEGDMVVQRFRMRGTQNGELMGVPPTGRFVEMEGINFFRLKDGLLEERWGIADVLSALQQMGVLPA
jgi:steroid delta-isomerase-like uncharacterized protein